MHKNTVEQSYYYWIFQSVIVVLMFNCFCRHVLYVCRPMDLLYHIIHVCIMCCFIPTFCIYARTFARYYILWYVWIVPIWYYMCALYLCACLLYWSWWGYCSWNAEKSMSMNNISAPFQSFKIPLQTLEWSVEIKYWINKFGLNKASSGVFEARVKCQWK